MTATVMRPVNKQAAYGLPRRYGTGKTQGKGGIPCPECGHPYSAVTDSRAAVDGTVRRRRCCMRCELRYTTYEMIAISHVTDYQI